ncbi:response regulator transcription factor [Enterococcus alishanensis]|uniref:Response regulator transcription factor n=1 Tax=Enterococcus alishanensis TaxID=1303817 RepID=A0ABS6TGY7_9ENTE|nr:response regulator transcription factor [Enterococcus alishanensis]MBV7392085.1 response regulator transcription factor [Enterococcus alishanensis]
MTRILMIDDDPQILKLMKTALERQGYQVETAENPSEVTLAKAKFADLILLDVMMPEEDGFSYLERIRQQVDVPILFVTAKTAEQDLIHGLGIGADDYIEKPFSIGELRARVASHLRREKREHHHVLRSGELTVDLEAKQFYFQSEMISFTKSEYAICVYLLEHAEQVFSKEQIYEAVFGLDGVSDETVIVEHIKNIRSKLKKYQLAPIQTVWGIGYKWQKNNPLV